MRSSTELKSTGYVSQADLELAILLLQPQVGGQMEIHQHT